MPHLAAQLAAQLAAPIPRGVARRGRRRTDTIPAERSRHLLALALRDVQRWPVETVRRFFDLGSRRTVSLWCERARGYPEAADRARLIEESKMHDVLFALVAPLN